jgi:hypothetical protein
MVQQLLTQQYISETRVVACFPPLKVWLFRGCSPHVFLAHEQECAAPELALALPRIRRHQHQQNAHDLSILMGRAGRRNTQYDA